MYLIAGIALVCALPLAIGTAQNMPPREAWTRTVMNGIPPAGQAAWSAAGVAVVGPAIYIGGSAFQPPHRGSAYVSKYDLFGNGLWTATADGFVNGLAADESGVYLAGFIPLFGYPGAGAYGILYKFDTAGSAAWAKQLSMLTFAEDHSSDIRAAAATPTGVCITGSGWLDDGDNSTTGAFLRQYDTAGNVIWTIRLEAGVNASALAADSSGIYVAGSTTTPLETALTGTSDAFIRKYDTGGNLLSTIQFGTPGAADSINGIAVLAGDIHVSGSSTAGQEVRSFVSKYDRSGDLRWTAWSETGTYFRAIAVSSGAVYASGTASVPLTTALTGLSDAFVRKYNPAGHVMWAYQFGVPNTAGESDSVATGADGVYVGVSAVLNAPSAPPAGESLLLFLPDRGNKPGQ